MLAEPGPEHNFLRDCGSIKHEWVKAEGHINYLPGPSVPAYTEKLMKYRFKQHLVSVYIILHIPHIPPH